MSLYCGIDWSEQHHDVAVVDHTGALMAKRRIDDSPAGWRELLRLLADLGEGADEPIPVAIETTRGLLVSCLRATGLGLCTRSTHSPWRTTVSVTASPAPSQTTPTP